MMSHTLVQKICSWTKCLCLKPSKCWSLALGDRRRKKGAARDTSYGSFDPGLSVGGQPIAVIGNEVAGTKIPTSFKFLGRTIRADLKDIDGLDDLRKKFFDMMKIVGAKPINGMSKSWIYSNFVINHMLWGFLIYDLSKNQIINMQSKATQYLKTWLGLHITANPAILYLP